MGLVNMWSEDFESQIGFLGESGMIDLIQEFLREVNPHYPEGIGDDCAVVDFSGNKNLAVLTTDSVLLGRHFLEDSDPYRVGRKLVNRNLSDVASMGGVPSTALLNLIVSPQLSKQWMIRFIEGVYKAASDVNLKIVGGDLCRGEDRQFIGNMSLVGFADNPVLRKGAVVGDSLYVTGKLGGSILAKHLDFKPRLEEGLWLSKQKEVRSMLDITDGFAKDINSLLTREIGVSVNLEVFPISEDCFLLAQESKKSALEHALTDGEDYELLFILSKDADGIAFHQKWGRIFDLELTKIGVLVKQSGIQDALTGKTIECFSGYEHF